MSISNHPNWARIAGLSYLGVAILAGFAEFSVRTGMVVPGDAAGTMANIAASRTVYALAGIADLAVILLDVVLAVAFWYLLKPVSRPLALAALILNLLRLPWMGANAVFHFGVLILVDHGLAGFAPGQVEGIAQLLLQLHAYGYTANGILFGAWCFTIGLLFVRSGFVPKLLGYAMVLALVGYWADLFVAFVTPELDTSLSPILVMPAALAEIAVCLWFSVMGGRVDRGFRARISPAGAVAA